MRCTAAWQVMPPRICLAATYVGATLTKTTLGLRSLQASMSFGMKALVLPVPWPASTKQPPLRAAIMAHCETSGTYWFTYLMR